jgi:uncharacterized Ntn-hydrolase superfamily protein
MRIALLLLILSQIFCLTVKSQDTFSIVAVDSITGEVGSAGASCVDLTNFPGLEDHFLGELFPGLGAINTQAWYIQANQINARNRMNAGDTPSEIIEWLVNNDINNQPNLRQYGIVAMVNNKPASAAHTGTSTDNYKNHITGPNYAIQGNILLGQQVLDSMESKFLNAEGDLACRLMAAMQGANLIGADSRCASNGTSSLFAFIKVAQPDDTFGNPSFVQSVKTSNGDGVEPIDSLQILFDAEHNCVVLGINEHKDFDKNFVVFPNPFNEILYVQNLGIKKYKLEIFNGPGNIIFESTLDKEFEINASKYTSGMYFIKLSSNKEEFIKRLIKY